MYGQSRYRYNGGEVTITKLDRDDFAPNDADLIAVRDHMREMLRIGSTHLSFTINGMRVEIEPDIDRIMREALKPLDAGVGPSVAPQQPTDRVSVV